MDKHISMTIMEKCAFFEQLTCFFVLKKNGELCPLLTYKHFWFSMATKHAAIKSQLMLAILPSEMELVKKCSNPFFFKVILYIPYHT